MLPGFRFLFAAIVLSMSILVFGLGAAALLRAAHEEFASIPARPTPREPVFAQPNEAPQPTLALLRVEPSAAEKAPAELPAASEPVAPTPDATAPCRTRKAAALKPEETAKPDEVAKPEASAQETTEAAPAAAAPAPAEAAPASTGPAPASAEAAPASAEAPAPPADVKLAAISDAPQPANEAAPAPPAQMDTPTSPETAEAATKIATSGRSRRHHRERGRRETGKRKARPRRTQQARTGKARQTAPTGRATRPARASGGSDATAAKSVRAAAADDHAQNAVAFPLRKDRWRPAVRPLRPIPSTSRRTAPGSRRRDDRAQASARRR